jgi:hypothetical protein
MAHLSASATWCAAWAIMSFSIRLYSRGSFGPVKEVERYIKGVAGKSLHAFKTLVRSIHCSNDCAKRNIRLILDFANGYKNKDMKQNLKPGTTKRSRKGLTKQQLISAKIKFYILLIQANV